jgi:hypothetical protein
MINGAHLLLYSKNAEADRAFFRDVLELDAIDVGGGWLIFALPPAEMAVHPSGGGIVEQHAGQLFGAELYLMCDDLAATMTSLAAKNVKCSTIEQAGWGAKTTILLPSGGEVGLYQPRHPTAFGKTKGS